MQGLSRRKPVGTFAGKRKTRSVTVRHRLQWAPFQRTVPYSFSAPLQAWGARGRVFESLRPDHIIQGVARFYLATLLFFFVFTPTKGLALGGILTSFGGVGRKISVCQCPPAGSLVMEVRDVHLPTPVARTDGRYKCGAKTYSTHCPPVAKKPATKPAASMLSH
jgi:hypothetical protein